MVEDLIEQGFTGEKLIQKVMDLTGYDRADAQELIAVETTTPDGDLVADGGAS
jgi:hypothetical protein